jgi:dihydroneopterin aldolase
MAEALTRRFFLTGIETTCSIGIHDFERAAPQRVLVDVEVLLAADKEPAADHIDDALNYDDIRQTVVDIAESRHFDLQETLARTVFDAVRSMKTVIGVRVRTAKPDVYKDVTEAAYQLSDLSG